jgi:predicted TIM-barrel fold metal-dependent hydrolase
MGGGLVGIFARGLEWDMPLAHPSFWPIYEEAERQDLPICVHTGNGSSPAISRMLEGVPRPYLDDFPHIHPLGAGLVSNPYVIYGFQQLLGSSVLDDFPRLKLAFLEAGTEWAVRIVKRLRKRHAAKVDRWLAERVFLSCELEEDLPYVISKLGDACLITATDFPHGDAFRQDLLADGLRGRGDLPEPTVEKILASNPRRLWNL